MCFRALCRSSVLLVLLALPAFAGSRWVISGPDGGMVNRLVFDPDDPSIVYAGASNGLFRSSDGGQNWVQAGALIGTTVLDVAVAKSDSRTAYAATTYGLYRTTDRGSSWRLVNEASFFRVAVSGQNPDVVYGASFAGPVRSMDGGLTFGSRGIGLPNGVPSAIVIDPQDAATAYASFQGVNGVYKTTDAGAHWTQTGDSLNDRAFSIALVPGDSATLYAGGNSTMWKSPDGAASWRALDAGTNGTSATWLVVSPTAPSTTLAATNRGVLRSTN